MKMLGITTSNRRAARSFGCGSQGMPQRGTGGRNRRPLRGSSPHLGRRRRLPRRAAPSSPKAAGATGKPQRCSLDQTWYVAMWLVLESLTARNMVRMSQVL
jgi:hypothetical protein